MAYIWGLIIVGGVIFLWLMSIRIVAEMMTRIIFDNQYKHDGRVTNIFRILLVTSIIAGCTAVYFNFKAPYHPSSEYTMAEWKEFVARKCLIEQPRRNLVYDYRTQTSQYEAFSKAPGNEAHWAIVYCRPLDEGDMPEDLQRARPYSNVRELLYERGIKVTYDHVLEYSIFTSDPKEFVPPKMYFSDGSKPSIKQHE